MYAIVFLAYIETPSITENAPLNNLTLKMFVLS